MAKKAMQKAWEIYKKGGVRTLEAWSQALRKAWAIVKGIIQELPQLIGTEKQVAWAEKIRANVLNKINEELTRRRNAVQKRRENGESTPEEKVKKYIGEIETILAHVTKQNKAAWFIDTRELSFYSLINY